MKQNLLTLSLFLAAFLNASAQYTQTINSNRPSSSMGAYSVSKEIFQIEGGYVYQNDSFSSEQYNTQNNIQLQFRYGDIFEQLEFVGDIVYNNYELTINNSINKGSGFKTATFGAKYLIYDHYKYYVEKRNVYSWKANQRFKWRRLIPAISVYVGGQFNTKHNIYYPELPDIGLKTMLIAQQHLSKRFSITYNFVGENITDENFENYYYIITASLGLSDRFSIFGEHYGVFSRKYFENTIPFKQEANLKAGITYKINPNLQIDGFGGTSINNTPHKIQAGIGVSWRNQKKYIFKDHSEVTDTY